MLIDLLFSLHSTSWCIVQRAHMFVRKVLKKTVTLHDFNTTTSTGLYRPFFSSHKSCEGPIQASSQGSRLWGRYIHWLVGGRWSAVRTKHHNVIKQKVCVSVNCLITTCPLFHVGMSVLRLACFLFSVGIPLKKHLAVLNHRRMMTMNWRRKSTHCKRCFLSWQGKSCWRWDSGSPVWIAALAVPSRWQRLVLLPFSGHWKHQHDRRGCCSVPFKTRR